MRLILASASPRRRDLLARLTIPFEVVPPKHIEQHLPEEDAETTCLRLAEEKAYQVSRHYPQDLVIGADTIVIIDHEVLGKPTDLDNARYMLETLSGKTHLVKTAIALLAVHRNHRSSFVETTEVTFHDLDADDIEYYLSTSPPLDKAGAYGIQDWSGTFVAKVSGCYHNVVGFPLARFYRHLKQNGLWQDLLTIKRLEIKDPPT